jgi:hypothetical protein
VSTRRRTLSAAPTLCGSSQNPAQLLFSLTPLDELFEAAHAHSTQHTQTHYTTPLLIKRRRRRWITWRLLPRRQSWERERKRRANKRWANEICWKSSSTAFERLVTCNCSIQQLARTTGWWIGSSSRRSSRRRRRRCVFYYHHTPHLPLLLWLGSVALMLGIWRRFSRRAKRYREYI